MMPAANSPISTHCKTLTLKLIKNQYFGPEKNFLPGNKISYNCFSQTNSFSDVTPSFFFFCRLFLLRKAYVEYPNNNHINNEQERKTNCSSITMKALKLNLKSLLAVLLLFAIISIHLLWTRSRKIPLTPLKCKGKFRLTSGINKLLLTSSKLIMIQFIVA